MNCKSWQRPAEGQQGVKQGLLAALELALAPELLGWEPLQARRESSFAEWFRHLSPRLAALTESQAGRLGLARVQ